MSGSLTAASSGRYQRAAHARRARQTSVRAPRCVGGGAAPLTRGVRRPPTPMNDGTYSVWVTTEAHLQRFRAVWDSTSRIDRLRSKYSMPANFPQMSIPRSARTDAAVPLAILSCGELTITATTTTFQYLDTSWKSYRNLLDLSFSTTNAKLAITMVQYDYAPIRAYRLPYVGTNMSSHRTDAPLLISAAGAGPFTYFIKRRTHQIYQELLREGAKGAV